MCVRLCGSARMDYSDDEDFCLSQNSVKPFNQTQSSGYGEDVIDGYNQVVSLESGEVANFNLISEDICDGVRERHSSSIAIEDISSDEAVDLM